MKRYRHPIRRSVMLGCTAFILVLCLLLSALSYLLFSRAMYASFDERLQNAVAHVERQADADDLRACIESGRPSAHHAALQEKLNDMVDDFGLYYLYVVIPSPDSQTMVNVVSATSAAERAAGETDLPLLYVTDAYTDQELDLYRAAWEADGVTYFEESTAWGACYTACKPLRASDGTTVALICADLAVEEMHRSIRSYVLDNVIAVALVSGMFLALLFFWLRRNILRPILALEKSAKDFAAKSRVGQAPEELVFDPPAIRTGNEVESLADAVEEMAEDMKDYAVGLLSAEQRARSAEETAADMSQLAYQDALTHVKSKTAYDAAVAALEREIEEDRARFAVVMMDVNRLKKVNDTFGHEYGDRYLIGSCRIISDIYKHSPVFRIGGDEFVAILQGQDYANRTALLELLRSRFAALDEDESRPLYERYSVAAGMAEYRGFPGETAEQVIRRADREMYRNKQKMKNVER